MAAIEDWAGVKHMVQRRWTCGHCGLVVAGNVGYYCEEGRSSRPHQHAHQQLTPHQIGDNLPRILICPNCNEPTYFKGTKQVPGAAFGKPVKHLPADLEEIYTEARNCMSVNAFIPAVLTARTILMHIAVEQKAEEGRPFTYYVDFLVNGGFVPPNSTKWVDHIRVKGNEATHKITLMSRDDAEKVLRFVEMIMLFIYDYPGG